MLILTRKRGESVIIANQIEVTLVDVGRNQVRLGIDAPREISIYRKELHGEVVKENMTAASGGPPDPTMVAALLGSAGAPASEPDSPTGEAASVERDGDSDDASDRD